MYGGTRSVGVPNLLLDHVSRCKTSSNANILPQAVATAYTADSITK